MTIHAAKGLEFPVVCVADLGRSRRTRDDRLFVDGERVGLRLRAPDGGRGGRRRSNSSELRAEQRGARSAKRRTASSTWR